MRQRWKDVLADAAVVLCTGFLFSGGVATLMGVQPLYEFASIFFFFCAFEVILFDFYERHLRDRKGEEEQRRLDALSK